VRGGAVQPLVGMVVDGGRKKGGEAGEGLAVAQQH